jgi:hypothetical protein
VGFETIFECIFGFYDHLPLKSNVPFLEKKNPEDESPLRIICTIKFA